MKEEDRLAAVVTRIDEDAAIFPQGAYLRTPLNQVILNKSFQGQLSKTTHTNVSTHHAHTGLSVSEAQQLKYYCHFRALEPEEDADKVPHHKYLLRLSHY